MLQPCSFDVLLTETLQKVCRLVEADRYIYFKSKFPGWKMVLTEQRLALW
jgi:hypothetical protein